MLVHSEDNSQTGTTQLKATGTPTSDYALQKLQVESSTGYSMEGGGWSGDVRKQGKARALAVRSQPELDARERQGFEVMSRPRLLIIHLSLCFCTSQLQY